jgi:hypothetical protein
LWAGRDVGERKEGNEGRREREDDTERTGERSLREDRKRSGKRGGRTHYRRGEAERDPKEEKSGNEMLENKGRIRETQKDREEEQTREVSLDRHTGVTSRESQRTDEEEEAKTQMVEGNAKEDTMGDKGREGTGPTPPHDSKLQPEPGKGNRKGKKKEKKGQRPHGSPEMTMPRGSTAKLRPTAEVGQTADDIPVQAPLTYRQEGEDESEGEQSDADWSVSEDDVEIGDVDTTEGRSRAIAQIIGWIRRVMPVSWQGEDVEARLTNLASQALAETNVMGIQQAVEFGTLPDGSEYQVPTSFIEEDEAALAKGLRKATRERLRELDKDPNKGRINPDKVWKWISETNPDFDAILDIATNGATIMTPPEFIPNASTTGSGIPRPSPHNQKVGAALRKMVVEGFREPRLCFITTSAKARQLVPCFHCSPAQWAPKDGKKQGRNCNNCSFCRQGSMSMNGEWLRSQARLKWGRMQHPTLEDMVRMIVEFSAEAVRNGFGHLTIRLWKMDLKGAYTLISYRAEDVHLMACSVPDDLVIFFLCGTFGWGGTPYAFQVVTRALVWELNSPLGTVGSRLRGKALMYVDDLAGVSFEDDLQHDLGVAHALIEGLLGIGAVAADKTKLDGEEQDTKPGELNFIGYKIDHHLKKTGITRKNVIKACSALHRIGDGKRVTTRMVQRVASHASRYKRVCPLMAPFCRALHAAVKGHSRTGVLFDLDNRSMLAIGMMRVLILMVEVGNQDFKRSFASFSAQSAAAKYVIEYDASLTGLSVIWYERRQGDREVAVGCWRADVSSWGLEGSGFMNSVEFIAQTIGIIGLAQQGVRDVGVIVRGDNKAALKWGTSKAAKGRWADNAAFVQTALCTARGIEVVGQEHLHHRKEYDENWRCDEACRFLNSWAGIIEKDKRDTTTGMRLGKEMKEWEIQGEEDMLELCHPLKDRGTGKEFERFIRGVLEMAWGKED